MKTEYIIRTETTRDYRETENVVHEAFWNVYRAGCVEHYVLHEFRGRADFIRPLSLVVEKDERIIGYIMYARAKIERTDGNVVPVVTFGPFGVLPKEQDKGYGSALLRYSMAEAESLGANAIAITGNYDLYRRYGFVAAKSVGIRYADDPEADYFLIKELKKGFLADVSGTYKDPDGYFVDETAAETFDRTFPWKEKVKKSSHLF